MFRRIGDEMKRAVRQRRTRAQLPFPEAVERQRCCLLQKSATSSTLMLPKKVGLGTLSYFFLYERHRAPGLPSQGTSDTLHALRIPSEFALALRGFRVCLEIPMFC